MLVALAFAGCAGDEDKRVARDDDGGEGGEAGDAFSAGGSSLGPAGADSGGVEAGGSQPGGGTDGGEPNGPGGTPSDGGTGGTANPQGGEGPIGTPISVAGLVVAMNEQPFAGITLRVQGKEVVTAADGTFQVDVLSPYDIVIGSDAYLGVTRADPKLHVQAGPNRAATVAGNVSGGAGFPQPVNTETTIMFAGKQLTTFSNTLNAASNGNYVSSGQIQWLDSPTLQGSLYAVQRNTSSGAILGVGSKVVTLTDGQQLGSPASDVVLAAPVLRDFDVSLSGPAGVTFSDCNVSVGPLLFAHPSPASELTVQVPNNIPDDVGIFALAYGRSFAGLELYGTVKVPADALNVDFAFSDFPIVTAPANNAQLPPSAVFSYTSPADEMTALTLTYTIFGNDSETEYTFNVYTDLDSVPLSRLDGLGFDLSPGVPLSWTVATRAEAESVDAFLDPAFIAADNSISSKSPPRSFTR